MVSDRIKAGELILFRASEKERAEAKARLEGKRKRDHEFYHHNVEKERAKDRERYARKRALTGKRKSH